MALVSHISYNYFLWVSSDWPTQTGERTDVPVDVEDPDERVLFDTGD